MSEKTELQKVSEETMRFMRGKYALDEVGDGKDTLEFCENGETILTIRIHNDRYDFYVDGKCVPVSDLETLESVKQTVMFKKKPNRKPFPKENALFGNCGQRCDLCIHYTDSRLNKAFRLELHERFARVYKTDIKVFDADCNGCHNGGIGGKHDCPPGQCRVKKGYSNCRKDCPDYHSCMPSISSRWAIEPRSLSVDDVTWAILPYAHEQYGN
jgi:hypothetical protein